MMGWGWGRDAQEWKNKDASSSWFYHLMEEKKQENRSIKFKIRNLKDTREVKQILTDKVRGLRGGHVHLQVAKTEKPGSIETQMTWNPQIRTGLVLRSQSGSRKQLISSG